jgi:imidazolonepropionase-like amidohydrolase
MSAILFTNMALFDGVGPDLRRGAQVLVEDGRIQEVSDRAIRPPGDCEVIDLAGRTLMPGLIDAHVHIWATDLDVLRLITRRTEYLAAFAYRSLAAMLDRGFTTVRDAGGTDIGYAQALQDGLATGPRLLHAGATSRRPAATATSGARATSRALASCATAASPAFRISSTAPTKCAKRCARSCARAPNRSRSWARAASPAPPIRWTASNSPTPRSSPPSRRPSATAPT